MSALLQTGLLVDVNIGSLQWEVNYNPKEYCYKKQRVDTNAFWVAVVFFFFFLLFLFFFSIKFEYPAQTPREASLPEHSLLWACSLICEQPSFAIFLLFKPQKFVLALVLRSSI